MPVMTDVGPATAPAPSDALVAARDAMARHAWQEAFERFTQADQAGSLAAENLEQFGLAGFFAAHADVQLDVMERAFKAHEAAGNTLRAAYFAAIIARTYGFAGKASIASAWKRREEKLVEPGGDTYVHGYLALIESEAAAASGDFDAALSQAERAVAIGGMAADADLKSYAPNKPGAPKNGARAHRGGVRLVW